MIKEGKIIFKHKEDGSISVFVERLNAPLLELKKFNNAKDWSERISINCRYLKAGKQVKVWIDELGKKAFYDSSKSMDTPTYRKKPEVTLKTKGVEPQTSRRGSQVFQENKSKNPLTGKNLFKELNSIDYTRLPLDTRENLNLKEIDNNSLLINKLVHFYEFDKSTVILDNINKNKSESKPEPVLFRNNISDTDDSKKKWHYELPINFENAINQSILTEIKSKQKQLKEQLNLEEAILGLTWRLIVGLGGASVYETSMTLHHIYGFPYIPASTVKGVLRSWVLINCFNGLEDKEAETKAGKCEKFKNIFGTQESASKVTFLDAFPTKAPTIKADVMTVHYDKWYSKGEAPADTMSPNPISFLTVEDTPFQFLFGSKDFDINQELWELEINGETKNGTLLDWLKNALENHGIGAKTAVGYGYMSENK